MLDVMSDAAPQAAWLREALAKSRATWKIAVFHFPLYSHDEPYPNLVEAWGTLFDEYHVDPRAVGAHPRSHADPIRCGPERGLTPPRTEQCT